MVTVCLFKKQKPRDERKKIIQLSAVFSALVLQEVKAKLQIFQVLPKL